MSTITAPTQPAIEIVDPATAPVLARIEQPRALAAPSEWESKLDLVKSLCCKPKDRDATKDEFDLFCHVARSRRLDPLARQIYAVFHWDGQARKEKMCIQTGIDGFRLGAQRTGQYRGQTAPEWCGDDGKWVDVWLKDTPPKAARVGVYRAGFAEVCWGVAVFASYVQTNGDGKRTGQWLKMPEHMIAKCAEALALRKAFPDELGDIYTDDEMAQADNLPPPPPPPANRGVPPKPEEHAPDGSGYSVQDVNTLISRWSGVQPEDLPSVKRTIKAKLGIEGNSVDTKTLHRIGEFVQSLIDTGKTLADLNT